MRNAFMFLTASLAGAAFAQNNEPATQRGGTYYEPPARVDSAYLPAGPDHAGEGAEPLKLTLSLELPLKSVARGAGLGPQGTRTSRGPTLQADLAWRPFGDSGWFAQVRFYRDLGHGRQSWHPDFSYVFGYDPSEPDTFSLVYSNYTGTRISPFRANFPEGQLSAGWKFALPELVAPWFLTGEGDSAMCSNNANLTPRFIESSGLERNGKLSLSLGCRYMHPSGWYGHFTAFAYPGRGQQQPWDPDFTYSLGYGPPAWKGVAVEYANYSGNRWPGRDTAPGEGRLRSGSLMLNWASPW